MKKKPENGQSYLQKKKIRIKNRKLVANRKRATKQNKIQVVEKQKQQTND